MKRIATAIITVLLCVPAVASAHISVKPAEVGVASFQTFTTGVPNEKEIAVTGVRLVIPDGMNYVQPTVKAGWTVDIKKDGDKVTELNWTGGTIPAGQRDDFTFGAQAPAKTTTLAWKAYQTYEDGSVAAWDQKSDGKHSEDSTPYSETKVVDDLAASTEDSHGDKEAESGSNLLPTFLSVIAVVLAASAFVTRRK